MKKQIIFALLISACLAPLEGQEFPAELQTQLQTILDQNTNNVIKGASVCVILPNCSEWTGVSGIATTGREVDTDHLWNFGSQVKSIISTVILQLDDQGLLSIDDPFSDYLDPIPNTNGDASLRQLMNQSSLNNEYWSRETDLWGLVFSDRGRIWTIDEVLPYILEPFTDEQPAYHYVNTNAILLGKVIESVKGKHAAEVIEEMIFNPLGMEHSLIPVSSFDMSMLNGAWNHNLGNPFNVSSTSHDSYFTSRYAYNGKLEEATWFTRKRAMGELYSNELAQASLIPSPGSRETVSLPGATYTVDYGLGMNLIDYNGIKMIGHGGTGISQSLSFHFLEHDLTIGLVNNVFGSEGENLLLYQALTDQVLAYLENHSELYGCSTGISGTEFISKLSLYPNPAQDGLSIEMELQASGRVSISLFNPMGQEVEVLLSEEMEAGSFKRKLSFRETHASGIYFLSIRNGDTQISRKLVLK